MSRGVAELEAGEEPLGRARRPGGGRKRAADLDPGLRPALLALVEPDERGDPMSPLRWTTKSTAGAGGRADRARGTGSPPIRSLTCCTRRGSACRATPRPSRAGSTRTGMRSSGTSTSRSRPITAGGDPVVSVDTKKKELVGAYKNGGREWRPEGEPAQVRTHDFPDPELGKAIPYGVYDVAANAGWVNVGTDHDTAAFAVESIRRWWHGAGRGRLPAGAAAADHRGRGRLQRLPHPGVEGRAGRAGRPGRAGDHRAAISRRAPPSGTPSSTGCSPTSR